MEELAAAFALEALLDEERAEYSGHLEGCALCRQLVGQFQTVADLLPETLESERPTAGLKDRILTEARRGLEPGATPGPSTPVKEMRAGVGWQWTGWLTPVRLGAATVLVIVIAGLIGWNISLQLGAGTGLADEQLDLIEAIAAGAQVTELSGTEKAPDASGSLVQAPSDGKSFILLRNMPRLSEDQEFHMWRIAGDVPTNIGSFVALDEGDQVVALSESLSGADAFGVSIERKGTQPAAPIGDIVILKPL